MSHQSGTGVPGEAPSSNIRDSKVAVNALLGDSPDLVNMQRLMANLGDKEVFDDVCSELAMAILQFFQGNLTRRRSGGA